MNVFASLLKLSDLRQRLLFTCGVIILYRLGTHIPISGIDLTAIEQLFSSNGLLGFIDMFSGGALSRFSLFALGILPYINASIIMQMMTFVSPKLKDLAQEGLSGQKQMAQYTRYLTLAIALIQGTVMAVGFRSFVQPDINIAFFLFYSIVGLSAGSVLVMWFGEVMTEKGIGNGASILIFVGIISQLPFYIKNTVLLINSGVSKVSVVILLMALLLLTLLIVIIQEAQRRVQVQYARRVVGRKMMGGNSTYIPLRLIQGGVLPIIFASALLQFPLMISEYSNIEALQQFMNTYYRYDGFAYNAFFCFLIFFFTYFYTAISFDPKQISDTIKKHGGFILGIRPGAPTVQYLDKVVSKLTLTGAVALSFIALIPTVAANFTGIDTFRGLGGTALLIMVAVAMDFYKQVETYLINRKYDSYT